MFKKISNSFMIKNLMRSMRLLSVPRNSFGVLFIDDERPPFDVLITDIEKNDLHEEISSLLKKKYLSPLSAIE